MTKTLYAQPDRHAYLRKHLSDPYQTAITGRVLAHLGLCAGDRMLEVGAGVGRYTRQLRRLGLAVLATEPDPLLFDELQRMAPDDDGLQMVRAAAGDLGAASGEVAGVCGFHVLHHLGSDELAALAADIRHLSGQRGFKGWFFVEPNPTNPLYPLQIAITAGMHFAEEKGIWSNDYRAVFSDNGLPCAVLGDIGILPPQLSARLPLALAVRLRPELRSRGRLGPLALYRVFGWRGSIDHA
jgi:hypothetical protein